MEPANYDHNINIQQIRKDFPLLRREVYGTPIAYLDNAATTQKPYSVIEAEERYYKYHNANVHRGVHVLSTEATELYESARESVKNFIGAESTSEIVFVRGTTEAINLVASTYGTKVLSPGDEVVLTEMEHHSNIVPWQIVCEKTGARIRLIQVDEAGVIDSESLDEVISDKTKIVSITHASNTLGVINPIQEVIKKAHWHGAVVLVDGAQAVAHLRVSVKELNCDFYAFSSHKMYGPMGIGALYAKKNILEFMPPYQGGGDMITSVSFEKTTYKEPPHRFEAGTPNVAGAVGFAESIAYLTDYFGLEIAEHEHLLDRMTQEGLLSIPRLKLYCPGDFRVPVVSFNIEGIHPHDVATVLDSEGVAVRAGHHCTQPLMKKLGIHGTVRASYGLYNTVEEVDRLLNGIKKSIEVLS